MTKFLLNTLLLILGLTTLTVAENAAAVTIVVPKIKNPRMLFGAENLKQALEKAGYQSFIKTNSGKSDLGTVITLGVFDDVDLLKKADALKIDLGKKTGKEGFRIFSKGKNILILGADPSGVLYGCLEVAGQVKKLGKLPASLSVTDQPEMVLRGACIGIQKPYYLPGRTVYKYPYTPENFPWFYDKNLWIKYLDMLVENRMNSLYLWNGHPFASLVKLKDYWYPQTWKRMQAPMISDRLRYG